MELEDIVISGSFWTDRDGNKAYVIYTESEEFRGEVLMRIAFWYKSRLIDILTTKSSWLKSMTLTSND